MLIVKDFTISDPDFRDIEINNARPILASVAPIVKMIIKKNISICVESPIYWIAIIVSVRVVASSLSNVIKIWRRWIIVVRIVLDTIKYINKGRNMDRIRTVLKCNK